MPLPCLSSTRPHYLMRPWIRLHLWYLGRLCIAEGAFLICYRSTQAIGFRLPRWNVNQIQSVQCYGSWVERRVSYKSGATVVQAIQEQEREFVGPRMDLRESSSTDGFPRAGGTSTQPVAREEFQDLGPGHGMECERYRPKASTSPLSPSTRF